MKLTKSKSRIAARPRRAKAKNTRAGGLTIVKIHTAKTTLSKLILRVLKGERIVIARDHVPMVELVPAPRVHEGEGQPRRFGALRGVVAVTEAFFLPLPADELVAWES